MTRVQFDWTRRIPKRHCVWFLYDANNHSQKYTQIIRKMTIQINSPSQNIYVTAILYRAMVRWTFLRTRKKICSKLICSKSPISDVNMVPRDMPIWRTRIVPLFYFSISMNIVILLKMVFALICNENMCKVLFVVVVKFRNWKANLIFI